MALRNICKHCLSAIINAQNQAYIKQYRGSKKKEIKFWQSISDIIHESSGIWSNS